MNKEFKSIQFKDNAFGYYYFQNENNNSPILFLTNDVQKLTESSYVHQLTERHSIFISDLQTTPTDKRQLIDPPLETYALRIKKLNDLELTNIEIISTLEYGAYVLELLKTDTNRIKHFIGINTPTSSQSYTESFSAPIERKLNASIRQANISMGAGFICYQINECERILFKDEVDLASLKNSECKVDLIVYNDTILESTTNDLLKAFKNSSLTKLDNDSTEALFTTILNLI